MKKKRGKITVITGPMFSGKTGKLVSIIEVLKGMGKKVFTVKPKLDNRFTDKEEIYSHDHKCSQAIVIDGEKTGLVIDKVLKSAADVVIFDEVQFFNKETIKQTIRILSSKGMQVIAAGLMYDFRRLPFGATADLLGMADESLELKSICQKCGSLAQHSERVRGSKSTVDVGAADKYIAVCEKCHKIYA